MLCHVALVRTDVSEELSASFIRVTRIGELGATLAVTSNRRTLRKNTKHLFLQEPHGVTSQKTPFFIVSDQCPWPLVRKRSIPTDRPPLIGEI
jgi:hypothetical protein